MSAVICYVDTTSGLEWIGGGERWRPSLKTLEFGVMCSSLLTTLCVRPTVMRRSSSLVLFSSALFFQVYEQDDLSEQMASLEGLMKQLNAITGSAF